MEVQGSKIIDRCEPLLITICECKSGCRIYKSKFIENGYNTIWRTYYLNPKTKDENFAKRIDEQFKRIIGNLDDEEFKRKKRNNVIQGGMFEYYIYLNWHFKWHDNIYRDFVDKKGRCWEAKTYSYSLESLRSLEKRLEEIYKPEEIFRFILGEFELGYNCNKIVTGSFTNVLEYVKINIKNLKGR